MSLSNWDIVLRLLAATIVGAIFGIERKKNHKPVGARTHILICLAACIITMISAYGFDELTAAAAAANNVSEIRSDPARLMVGIVTGIGFLGAGIIWRSTDGLVHGVTTAAAVYLVAVLGIVAGMGEYFLLAVSTAIAIATLLADNLADNIKKKRKTHKKIDDSDNEQQ